jgi:hypothetical protein
VDLTVPLGTGAAPDAYSDMTGVVNIVSTAPEGTWTVIDDSGVTGNTWDTIIWNTEPEGDEPLGTSITVEARAADSEADLEAEPYTPVSNDVPFSLTGQFIQIRATLKPDSEGTSPILSDLETISAIVENVPCFVNDDDIVDRGDIGLIVAARNTPADSDDDPRDADRDGVITVLDARKCVLVCTYPRCVPNKASE